MTAAPQIELQPLEWAIVAALHAHGTLTTSALAAAVAEAGRPCTRGALKQRVYRLARRGVLVHDGDTWVTSPGNTRGGWEARYRLRLQG